MPTSWIASALTAETDKSPGHVDTPFIRQSNPHSPNDWSTSIENPENFDRRVKATPLGRLCNCRMRPRRMCWRMVETVLALNRADIELRFAVELRNRALEAYNQIIRISV